MKAPSQVAYRDAEQSAEPVDERRTWVKDSQYLMAPSLIDPPPPLANLVMAWDAVAVDPVADIAAARAEHGDTFAVCSGDEEYLFVFSPKGVRAFYDVDEAVASKGVADWRMLRRKLPDGLFADRRSIPHDAFGRNDVERYREALEHALDLAVDELGASGSFDVFDLSRRIGHRLGLASWGGSVFASGELFEGLVAALDVLDPSDAFVHPERMGTVADDSKAREYAALATANDLIVGALSDHGPALRAGPLGLIIDRWADTDTATAHAGVANDLILLHLASMSNLFAATGWLLADLLLRPDLAAAALADPALMENCALESIRMAQRSIMLREVLQETTLSDESTTYRLQPGATVATLLSLTNTSAAAGLEDYDPARWVRRRLSTPVLEERTLVTTFGHGAHTCPAQPFSLHAMVRTAHRVLGLGDLTAEFTSPAPLRGQIGGVGRSQAPCPVHFVANP